jgi:transposase
MLKDFSTISHIYIATGYTDLRRGIDGLVSIVQQVFQLDPFKDSIFLFCGRKPNRIKALYWDKNGFVILYKRLEEGKFQWPRSQSEVRDLSKQQLRWLMEGLSIDQPKAHKAVSKIDLI